MCLKMENTFKQDNTVNGCNKVNNIYENRIKSSCGYIFLLGYNNNPCARSGMGISFI